MPPILLGVLGSIGSTLLGIAIKSLSKGAVESLVLLGLRKLSEHTESDVDDELYRIVKGAIQGPQELDLPSDVPPPQ